MTHTHQCPMCGCIMVTPMFDGEESEAQTCIACKGRFRIHRTRVGEHWSTKLDRSMYRDDPVPPAPTP